MADRKEKESGRRSFLRVLLGMVFLAFCLSSGMVGYVLGRGASRTAAGELVDTIVLSPGATASARFTDTLHFLAGRVSYPSGEPCAGVTVSIGKASDETDENGKYYLSDVKAGSYTLRVETAEGVLMGATDITLDFSDSDGVSADLAEGAVAFCMPESTRMLELDLTVGEDQVLTVEEDSAYFVTRDGQMADFYGSSLHVKEPSRALTPSGNLIDPAGNVLVTSKGVAVTAEEEEQELVPGEEILPGVTAQEDGSVQLEGGISLTPAGELVLPDGDTLGGDKVVVIAEGDAEEIEELPEVYTPPAPSPEPDPTPVPEPTHAPEPSEESEPAESEEETPSPAPTMQMGILSGKTPAPTAKPVEAAAATPVPTPSAAPQEAAAAAAEPTAAPTPAPTPEPTPEPTPTPAPTPTRDPEKSLQVKDAETGISWTQLAFIDLFKKRGNNAKGTKGALGDDLIAPGDKGYYEIKLKNPENFRIGYTIAIQEESFHLPIHYSVLDAETYYPYLIDETTSMENPNRSEQIIIPSGGEQVIRIEWQWEYSNWYRPEIDDAIDTEAASRADTTYVITLLLDAVQMDPHPDEDGDTRYPGMRD